MAHESNYLLAGAYNFQGWSSSLYEEASSKNISFDNIEVQFQLSIKTPLAIDLFDKDIGIFAAYTMRSFWQAYNSDISSPFRETNHRPEVWIQSEHDWELFGIKNTLNVFGVVHQSNGQVAELSRSWNRLFAGFLFEKDQFALYLKPWIRISESEDTDDNPDITDYLGHGEIHLAYKRNNHVFSLMSRNNLESGFSRGAVKFGWSFPLFNYDYIKGYIQYFSGYGESLIDYDSYVNRLGVGILLTDIL
jgi:phospholipase A1